MSDVIAARLTVQLQVEEGVRSKLYLDTKGIPSAGVGRNMRDVGLRPDEIALMLSNDIKDHCDFMSKFSWYSAQSDVRQAALVDMSFMGPEKLLHFPLMIAALVKGDYDEAAAQVIDSQWFKDVGETRGNRIATMIKTGAWAPDINYGVPTP
jgi:lysozyme